MLTELPNSLRQRYTQRIQDLVHEKADNKSSNSEQEKFLKSGLNLIENFRNVFEKADVLKKKKLLSSIFTEKIQILENECRTPKLNQALLLMLAADKGFNLKENGQLFDNLKLSGHVEK